MTRTPHILVLAPRGRDAAIVVGLLERDGYLCSVCDTIGTLVSALDAGCDGAVIAEEALGGSDFEALPAWLAVQPPWSDFPFVLLATRQSGPRPPRAFQLVDQLGNVVLLERPLHAETLLRAVASSVRARARQYETRRHLDERAVAEASLRTSQDALAQFNNTLESRIVERTRELALANDRLMKEINEREKAQAALLQSQKMEALGQLTGGIAHDFNNLLNVIMGNADLMMRISADPRVREMAGVIKRATERGAKLTGQLLAFSRSGDMDLRAVDVVALVTGMADLLLLSVGSGVTVTTRATVDAAWALADPNQLELAILNLAINARDAMPDGGSITIETCQRPAPDATLAPGEYVVVSVTDTGSGIRPEILSKVFDPFFTTKSIGKGTGLGLSQVYGIATQAGGTARVTSTLGVGTTVEVWMPLRAAERAGASLAPAEPRLSGGHEKILVVEDDTDVRAFLVECLQMLGYQVTEAVHGMAGLERIPLDNPDLLIVDFSMPGINGAEVISRVRETHPALPVILATGYADAGVDGASGIVDPAAILRKPFQVSDLARTVKNALARSAT